MARIYLSFSSSSLFSSGRKSCLIWCAAWVTAILLLRLVFSPGRLTLDAIATPLHAQDGVAGTRARLAAAQRHAPKFGIATECGMARARSEETVRALLKIHADLCAGA